MKRIYSLFIFSSILISQTKSQNVGINSTGATPNSSAGLDVNYTNMGVLIPRVTLTQTTSNSPVTSPATSLVVYNSATVNDVTPGFYYWDGTKWVRLINTGNNAGTEWLLAGNTLTGTLPASPNEFIGTNNGADFILKTNGSERMRISSTGLAGINATPAGAYLKISSSNASYDGVDAFHTSGTTGSAFNAVAGDVQNGAYTHATGYLAYHNSFNKTFSVYGNGGDLAGMFNGKVGVNTVSTRITPYDFEVRNTSVANPANVLLRQTTTNTVSGTVFANLDFGDDALDDSTQARIQIIRDAAGGAGDRPTAMTFATTADGTTTLSERVRITNGGYVGIGTNSTVNEQLEITKNFRLPVTASAGAVGVIMQGPDRFIHNYSPTGNTAPASGSVGPNLFVGYQAGNFTLTKGNNTGIGYQALSSLTTGFLNVAVGLWACNASATCQNNTGVGAQCLESNTAGFNTAVGMAAFSDNVTGIRNVSIGEENLTGINSGNNNTNIGSLSGFYSLVATTGGGSDNTAVGFETLFQNTTGGGNVVIGSRCDTTNTTGSLNTVIGYKASAANLSNATAIGNGASATVNNTMVFGNASITDNYFTGNVHASCGILSCSDLRYKKEIKPIQNALNDLLKLRAVNYYFKTNDELKVDGISSSSFRGNSSREKQVGFIAQQVEPLFPEVVHTDNEGYKSIDYSRFKPLLVQAMQEQQKMIDAQQKEISELKAMVKSMMVENNSEAKK